MAHRVAVAGYSGQLGELFSPNAVARIADLSEGVPRVINNLCFNSLSLSYALGTRQIDVELVEEAALDLGLSEDPEAKADDREAEEREDADAISEWSAAFRGAVRGAATTTTEAADSTAEKESEEQSGDAYSEEQPGDFLGPQEGRSPAFVAPENQAGLIGRVRGKQKEAVLARGLACLLVLLLTPAIDWPANHIVSAKSITTPLDANSGSAADVISQHERGNPHTKYASESHRRYSKRWRHESPALSRERDMRVPVDLRLASFVPEPLLKERSLRPMSLSARTPEMARSPEARLPMAALNGTDRARRPRSVSS